MNNKRPRYYLNKSGEFVIENYNLAKPFASFFPGIAGIFGIPMWLFYVNRGQGVVSFGTEDKNHSIAEFLPANEAWQFASLQGFRTFLKIKSKKQIIYYEPFQDNLDNLSFEITRKMKIKSYELTLEEVNFTLGLQIQVHYFTLANEPVAGLIRQVKIINIGNKPADIEAIDGLPQIVPYGTSNFFLKKMGRTVEAWMRAYFLNNKIAFYNLNVDPSDRPETSFIEGANFYLAFIQQPKAKFLKTIVDPVCLFGTGDFSYPRNFIHKQKFNPSISQQIKESKTPCAFSYLDFRLSPQNSKYIFSIIGYAHNKDKLSSQVDKILSDNYVQKKQKQNEQLIRQIGDNIFTESGCLEFDLYTRQTYLDNVLRGGYPISFETSRGRSVFYLYSRKHGDLERDYNNFILAPTYFSQGNGNYRDMNQNRRSDNWFNPDVKEANLVNFLNLIQADGFNPLVIKGLSFTLEPDKKQKLLINVRKNNAAEKINRFLDRPFSPGHLAMFIEDEAIELNITKDEFLKKALSLSREIEEAEHAEGFWTDHWTYNLDLIENFLSVYPEKLKEIFIDKKIFTFFDNAEVVQPRSKKYILTPAGKIRQYHSVKYDPEKAQLLKKRSTEPHKVRSNFGKGEVVYVNLLTKLLCLVANKLASLDAAGCGIEMEANKPNWFDSLNGLPSLFGSSTNETFELKRLIIFIEQALKDSSAFRRNNVIIISEIYDFLKGLDVALKEYFTSSHKNRDFIFWDKTYSLKENYREITRLGFSGKESGINLTELFSILDAARRKIELGITRAFDNKTNTYHTYFINEVADYEVAKGLIEVRKFRQIPLPLFLEGQMHALRVEKNKDRASSLYHAVKCSSLYDKQLKMYKVCASLKKTPVEIGRCRVFTPGWLENESVWLHMEYKFLLELLRCGLHEEFYREFFNCLIPFLDAKKYGRSILENSSFLVSSVFPDKSLHGNGFVARLSGSTAEFVSIWRTLNTGLNPFKLDKQGKLTLELKPILHKKLFSRKKTYTFKFLGQTLVTYHNLKLLNTFGKKGVLAKMYIFEDENNELITIKSNIIPHPYAERIRCSLIKKIDAYL